MGNYLWNLTWSGEYEPKDSGQDIVLDASGNIFITGWINEYEEDAFITKYDSNGIEIWNTTWDAAAYEKLNGIAVDDSSNVYVTGIIRPDGSTPYDILIAKFDSNGNEQWNRTWDGGYGDDYGNRLILDDSNNLYIAGSTENSSGYTDFLVLKFDNMGEQQWNYTWNSGLGDNYAKDLLIDDTNDIYILGGCTSDKNIIKKVDNSGIEKWNVTHDGGWSNIVGHAIDLDPAGSIYIAGETNNDVFIAKYQEIIPEEETTNEENTDLANTKPPDAAEIPGYSLPILISAISISLIVILIEKIRKLRVRMKK
jgi:hypothetical protein